MLQERAARVARSPGVAPEAIPRARRLLHAAGRWCLLSLAILFALSLAIGVVHQVCTRPLSCIARSPQPNPRCPHRGGSRPL